MAVAGLRRDRFVAAADSEQDYGRFLAQPVNSWSLGDRAPRRRWLA